MLLCEIEKMSHSGNIPATRGIADGSVEGPICETPIPEMPEFPTIAIPVAATIGLLLLIRRRKQK